MVAWVSMTPVGFLPPKVRSVTGTCSAIECTFSPCRPLTPARVGGRDQVVGLERTQRTEVEDAAEVDVEGVAALAGEHLAVTGSEWMACAAMSSYSNVLRQPDVHRRARSGSSPA